MIMIIMGVKRHYKAFSNFIYPMTGYITNGNLSALWLPCDSCDFFSINFPTRSNVKKNIYIYKYHRAEAVWPGRGLSLNDVSRLSKAEDSRMKCPVLSYLKAWPWHALTFIAVWTASVKKKTYKWACVIKASTSLEVSWTVCWETLLGHLCLWGTINHQ